MAGDVLSGALPGRPHVRDRGLGGGDVGLAPGGRLEPEGVERILPEMLRISAALSGDCTSSMSIRSTASEG
jgi:hypothetical protein